MKNAYRKLACFFLLVSSLWIAPPELLHACVAHEDSHDACADPCTGTAVGTLHHHCESLDLSVPPLLAHVPPQAPGDVQHLTEIVAAQFTAPVVLTRHRFLFFRGPPEA